MILGECTADLLAEGWGTMSKVGNTNVADFSKKPSRRFRFSSFSKAALIVFPIVIGLLVVRSGKSSDGPTKVNTVPTFCPYQTPEQWQQFLETAADNKKWVDTCEDSTCDSEYFQYVQENIQKVFETCQSYINHHEEIARCTQNMRRFTPPWLRQHDEVSYGFNVDNHTYLTDQDAPDKPQGMMKPPEEIVAALPNLGQVEEAARTHGWKYLTHDSALGGFRTFVIISDPQGRFDQWMLLNLQVGQSSITEDTPMSILSVQKKDAAGKPLSKVQIHFRDYTIQHNERGGYKLHLHENSNGKCYACHTNGMRQLIARRTPILDAQNLSKANRVTMRPERGQSRKILLTNV